MIIYHGKSKTKPKNGAKRQDIHFAYLPVFVKSTVQEDSIHPDMDTGNLIWLEKYIDTYRYNSIYNRWVLIKTEQLSQNILDKFSN